MFGGSKIEGKILNVGIMAGKVREMANKGKDVQDGSARQGDKRMTTEKTDESNDLLWQPLKKTVKQVVFALQPGEFPFTASDNTVRFPLKTRKGIF